MRLISVHTAFMQCKKDCSVARPVHMLWVLLISNLSRSLPHSNPYLHRNKTNLSTGCTSFWIGRRVRRLGFWFTQVSHELTELLDASDETFRGNHRCPGFVTA